MSEIIEIPNGAILNCFLPKKRGSLKRAIMNYEAKLIQKRYGFEKMLNHTAIIEKSNETFLVWEASVARGVTALNLNLYSQDAVFFITHGDLTTGNVALAKLKSQAGKDYDVKSWWIYTKYLISGKWAGKTTYADYSKKWFCSELIDSSWMLTDSPYKSTPNHVYVATRHNELWSGTWIDLVYSLKNGSVKIV